MGQRQCEGRYSVDALTDISLEGNQLGVFPDASGLCSEPMQRLSREMDFSQTVFILPAAHDAPDVRRT